jgi:hypothetical protein
MTMSRRRYGSGAIGNVAGGLRLAVADHDLADGRPQTVGADQSGAAIILAALCLRCDRAVRLIDVDDLLRRVELDKIGFAALLEQHIVQIGAMDERIGVMKFAAEGVIERNARDFIAGDGIEHDQVVWKHRERADRLDQSKPFEHPEHVRPELNASADLLEYGGLFDHLRGNALARQRQRGSQSADAAADDQDLFVFPAAHCTISPRASYFHLSPWGRGRIAKQSG